MHTIKVIAGGFALLALCLLIGRWVGTPTPQAGLAIAAKIFIPLWAVLAGINMWIGVSRAGYSVTEETPTLLIVFAVPAAAALAVLWRVSHG